MQPLCSWGRGRQTRLLASRTAVTEGLSSKAPEAEKSKVEEEE